MAVPLLLVALGSAAGSAADEPQHGFEPRLGRAAIDGKQLPEAEAAKLESRLAAEPDDIVARATLVGYYRPRFRDATAETAIVSHCSWFVHRRPELGFSASMCAVPRAIDPDGYAELKTVWLERASALDDPQVKLNAATFLTLNDPKAAEELLVQVQRADPDGSRSYRQLGSLYRHEARGAQGGERTRLLAAALGEYEQALQRADDEYTTASVLGNCARVALDAEMEDKAVAYAKRLLDSVDAGGEAARGYADQATHDGNLVLGMVALHADDLAGAKDRLLRSARLRGSPTLASFGPSMALARALLERGEREAVLEYFDRCRSFWTSGAGKLDEWSTAVRSGGMPDFGPNLGY